MTNLKIEMKAHPTETELADFLGGTLAPEDRERVDEHIASCADCLKTIVSAHEAVNGKKAATNRKDNIMKKINIYLVLAILSFILSFTMPRYFMQFLVATLLLGIKWVADSKSTKMLVMIYEAWRSGGEKEVSKIIEKFGQKKRF